MCLSSDYIMCVAKWAISGFPLSLIKGEVSGHVTDLTSDHLHEKARCTYNMWDVSTRGFLPFESFVVLRKITCHWQRCDVAAFCDRAEAYLWRHRSVTWPNLQMKKFIMSGFNREPVMLNFSYLSQMVTEQSQGTVWGAHPPPGRRGLKETVHLPHVLLSEIADL